MQSSPTIQQLAAALGVSDQPQQVQQWQPAADMQHTGVVKYWNEDKGFGFVTVEGLPSDVYVHRKQFVDGDVLAMGANVSLNAEYDVAGGKYKATALSGAVAKGGGKGSGGWGMDKGGAWGMDKGKGYKGKGKDWGCGGKGWGSDSWGGKGWGGGCGWDDWSAVDMKGGGKGKNKNAGTEDPIALGKQSGTVKAWLPKGFGFLKPDNGGPDIFVHKDCLGGMDGLEIGSRVSFDLQWDDARQKYLARSCAYEGGAPSSQAASANGGYGAAPGGGAGDARAMPYEGAASGWGGAGEGRAGDARAMPYDGAASGWGGVDEGSGAATAGTPHQGMPPASQHMMMQQ